MKSVEAVQGKWSVTEATATEKEYLTGLLASYTRAYCLAGAETDDDYYVEVTVKPVAGSKAGVIAFFTYADDWTERFIECVLDVANQKVRVDLVIGASRVTVAEREYTLTLGTEYRLKVHALLETDGTGTVTFSVNGVNQLVIEDLDTTFLAGMYGFSLEGSVSTNSAVFSALQKYTMKSRYSTLERVKDVLLITNDEYNEALAELMAVADETLNRKLTIQNLEADSSNVLIKEASAFIAAWLYRRRQDPAGAEAFKKEADAFIADFALAENFEEKGVRRG